MGVYQPSAQQLELDILGKAALSHGRGNLSTYSIRGQLQLYLATELTSGGQRATDQSV